MTANGLCEALSGMTSSTPGECKTFVDELPQRSWNKADHQVGKAQNAKHFNLYYAIEFKYDEDIGAFLGLNIREQF